MNDRAPAPRRCPRAGRTDPSSTGRRDLRLVEPAAVDVAEQVVLGPDVGSCPHGRRRAWSRLRPQPLPGGTGPLLSRRANGSAGVLGARLPGVTWYAGLGIFAVVAIGLCRGRALPPQPPTHDEAADSPAAPQHRDAARLADPARQPGTPRAEAAACPVGARPAQEALIPSAPCRRAVARRTPRCQIPSMRTSRLLSPSSPRSGSPCPPWSRAPPPGTLRRPRRPWDLDEGDHGRRPATPRSLASTGPRTAPCTWSTCDTTSSETLAYTTIRANGSTGATGVTVNGWASLPEDPKLVGTPGGGMRLVFGGSDGVTADPFNTGQMYSAAFERRGDRVDAPARRAHPEQYAMDSYAPAPPRWPTAPRWCPSRSTASSPGTPAGRTRPTTSAPAAPTTRPWRATGRGLDVLRGERRQPGPGRPVRGSRRRPSVPRRRSLVQ